MVDVAGEKVLFSNSKHGSQWSAFSPLNSGYPRMTLPSILAILQRLLEPV